MESAQPDLVSLSADIVSAYVSNNSVPPGELSKLLQSTFAAISQLAFGESETLAPELARPEPPVSVKKSVTPDFIICLEDGKKFASLKRHLRTKYDMSPDDYRKRWGLPSDYPMVAPNYSKRRSELAQKVGLGQRRAKAQASKKRSAA